MRNRTDKVSRINSPYMNRYDAHMERQNKRKRILRIRLILFGTIVLIFFFSLLTYHMSQRELYGEKQAEYESLQEEKQELKAEETSLLEEIKLLEDESYVLRIAKTNYFFTEEGEIVFKLLEEAPAY
ncbi:septum formation initiator family protein [Amphibacillus sp. MSJ-3]|uniref:FtsB family cell division protein n=1 Tax=Amphibacillus sp. MSJ-3 TaxID=2841505 RepID=UPI001C0EEF8E|nr:septum formation initiator family protein [Amphibacillus sp. MSJ-3]MBU5595539.1 septum formation initiator family protein [Amphibacillus sp. MSJ-3]